MTQASDASRTGGTTLEVRISHLPPLRVASAHVPVSATPERDAAAILSAWARANGLLDRPGARWFGFNNPEPREGDTAHGYEVWLTVPPDFTAASADAAGNQPVTLKDVAGGPYAVAGCTLATISATWEALWNWAEAQGRSLGQHQWLEELLNFRQAPDQEPVFDLYFPLASTPPEAAAGP